jgi:hypothetical protein
MNPPRYRYLDTLIHVFVVVLMISNLVGPKITAKGVDTFDYSTNFNPFRLKAGLE